MRRGIIKRISATVMAVAISVITITPSVGKVAYARDSNVNIDGKQYELDDKSKYAYSSGITPTTIFSAGSQFGIFTIIGDLTSISTVDGYTSYEVTNGAATLSYSPTGKVISAAETDWHICEDKSSEVNGEKLSEKIQKGAVILQTSNDGSNWITDLVNTNIADGGSGYSVNFYETKEVQLINGCYYRVIVAYEVERKIKKPHWYSSNSEQKKYVEVYEFYLKDSTDAIIAAGAHPNTNKVVGDKRNIVNTGKGNGFSGENAITEEDPHSGWTIGTFTLKGYTDVVEYQGSEYFLKTLGDAITLTFTLEQDINCLNNNPSLSISLDKDGSDQKFQVTKPEFKHGALIIRHTDFENRMTEETYIDYLAANARTGADTRVQLFEEGDYEVALDYEIKDSSGIDSYYNYRMFFTFKIRNGNNMVYAFDNATGSQLSDGDRTSNGFTLNTANSHYLTITVDRYSVVDGTGGKKLELVLSPIANDGTSYSAPGMYIVTVSNRYQPNGNVSKTFYVGDDPYIIAMADTRKSLDDIVQLIRYTDYEIEDYLDAMSKEHKSLDEIVSLVNQGYEIDNSGELIAPPELKPIEETTAIEEETVQEPEQEEKPEMLEKEFTVEPEEVEATEAAEEQLEAEEVVETEEEKKSNTAPVIVLLAIGASAVGVYATKRGKKKSQTGDNIKSDTTSDEKGGES